MINFLKSTEVNKFLPKERLIDKLELSSAFKVSLTNDIKKFTITNELSPKSMNIAKGDHVYAVFVIEIQLKQKDIEYKLIEAVAKKNSNKILFILRYENEGQLAVFYKKLYRSEWMDSTSLSIDVVGANFDEVWDSIVRQIALVEVSVETTKDDVPVGEQLAMQEERVKLQKEIARLEKQARNERQPKRKFEIVEKIEELKRKLEELK